MAGETIDIPVGQPATDAVLGSAADLLIARAERLPFTRRHLILGSMLAFATLFDSYDSNLIATALIGITAAYGLNFQQAGALISVSQFGQVFGALGAGLLSERFGRRTLLVWSFTIFGVMSVASGLSQDLNQLMMLRFVQGLGLGAEVPIAASLFNEFVRGKTRGLTVGLYESAFGWGTKLAAGIAFVAYAWLGPDPGWRVLFLFGGLPVLLSFVRARWLPESFRWLIQRGRYAEANKVISAFEKDATRNGRRLPDPIVVVSPTLGKNTNYLELFSPQYIKRTLQVYFQWFVSYYSGVSTFLPTLYVAGGLQPTEAVGLAFATQVIVTVWQYMYIPLFDRIGRRPMFGGGMAWSAAWAFIGLFLVVGMHSSSWQVLFAIGTLINLGTSVNTAMLYLYTPEIYPTRMRAWGTASATSMNRLAAAISPLITGVVLSSVVGVAGVFVISGVLYVANALAIFGIGIETRGRILEEIAT